MVARTNETYDPDREDLREAYNRGRRDERAERKRHPIMMTLMFLAAAIGVVVVVLALVNGSFGGAGQVVDQNLTTAADQAEPMVRGAASDASQAVKDATTSERTPTPGQPSN